MYKQLTYLFIAFLLVNTTVVAQRVCGSMDVLAEQLKSDPEMINRMQSIENHTQHFMNNPKSGTRAVVTIPVVFHIVYNTAAQNVSDAQIASQMQVLNDDFRKLNADVTLVPSIFAPLVADAEINFCMAQQTPTGAATTGIIRKSSTTTSWSTNDNVKKTSAGGDDPWDATKYLNIWVCNLSGGVLGYAQFPGGPVATDGVVITYTGFGTNGTAAAPFNKGRTATHEVGHYLNLRHIWGDANCGNDLVGDTPTAQTSNFGCPTFPYHVGTCSGNTTGEMTMNYMDYTDDACMYMYSVGQKARMQALFVSGGSRATLATSNGCTPGTGGTTCNAPASLTLGTPTTSSLTATWTGVAGGTSYAVEYKTATSSTWIVATSTASTSFTIAGLAASTSYDVRIGSNCGTTTGTYSTTATASTSSPTNTCADNYETNNTLATARAVPLGTLTATIGTSTDKDYFSFSNTTAQKNIRLNLTNLPLDYDLKLYNPAGTNVATSQKTGTSSESIVYNTSTVGVYKAYVYGYNGANSSSCYSLSIAITSSTVRNDGSATDAESEISMFSVRPNPVTNIATIDLNLEKEQQATINLLDISGRLIFTNQFEATKSNNSIPLDMSNLNNGMYLIQVLTEEGNQSKKIIVNH
jgi:Pregnancy-associated plasma protein-A/Secretion system C-terminal sorting domain/Fibronectin type III domain